ncbi:MAG: hypothetical protein K2R98_27475 [Gemmataceae bacterium]|nr:hypothetical protein [Gemmataceae bacterium]
MSLDEEYPKAHRDALRQVLTLLESDPNLRPAEREEIALGLNDLADKARDLDEIFERLLNEPHTPGEVGELLIAFQLTLGQVLGASDLVNGRLYDVGDRMKAVQLAGDAKS